MRKRSRVAVGPVLTRPTAKFKRPRRKAAGVGAPTPLTLVTPLASSPDGQHVAQHGSACHENYGSDGSCGSGGSGGVAVPAGPSVSTPIHAGVMAAVGAATALPVAPTAPAMGHSDANDFATDTAGTVPATAAADGAGGPACGVNASHMADEPLPCIATAPRSPEGGCLDVPGLWLPPSLLGSIVECGITSVYPDQRRALAQPSVVDQRRSLVFTAPTSGGKTLVGDVRGSVLCCAACNVSPVCSLLTWHFRLAVPVAHVRTPIWPRCAAIFACNHRSAVLCTGHRTCCTVEAHRGRCVAVGVGVPVDNRVGVVPHHATQLRRRHESGPLIGEAVWLPTWPHLIPRDSSCASGDV